MHPNRRWRASRSRARSPRTHPPCRPRHRQRRCLFASLQQSARTVEARTQPHIRFSPSRDRGVHPPRGLPAGRRPAVLDWTSFRPRLATTPLPFSLPSALRSGVRRIAGAAKPGRRTCTYEVTRHARRTSCCAAGPHDDRKSYDASGPSAPAKVRQHLLSDCRGLG